MIVSRRPGTTRDAIDTVLQRGDTTFVLVDTAGMRRKRKQRQGIEYYSELRALDAAERADVALVLVDAREGLVDQDLAVADVARKAQLLDARRRSRSGTSRSVEIEDVAAAARAQPAPAAADRSPSPPRPAAASTRLLDRVERLFAKHTARIPTGELEPLPRRAARGARAAGAEAAGG